MLKFNEIKAATNKDFKEALKIYNDSFPRNERQSVSTIKKRLKENLYHSFVGCLDDKVVFIALLYPLKSTDFVLLDYMATDKEYRDKLIGEKFIKYVLKKIAPKSLVLEVENPRFGNNKEQREKRLNFYKKLGAKEMKDVRYVLPPLSGDLSTEMLLMVLPGYNKGELEGLVVRKLVVQIYKELYNRNEDDDLLNSFVNDIKSSVALV